MPAVVELQALGFRVSPSHSPAKRPRISTGASDDDLSVSKLLISDRRQRPATREEKGKGKPLSGKKAPRLSAAVERERSGGEHASAPPSSSSHPPGLSNSRPRLSKTHSTTTTSTSTSSPSLAPVTQNGNRQWHGAHASTSGSQRSRPASPSPPPLVARKSAQRGLPSASKFPIDPVHSPYPTPVLTPPRSTTSAPRPPPRASTSRPEVIELSSSDEDERPSAPPSGQPNNVERGSNSRTNPKAKGKASVDPEDFISTAHFQKVYTVTIEWLKLPRETYSGELLNIVLCVGFFSPDLRDVEQNLPNKVVPLRLALDKDASDESHSYYKPDFASPLTLTFDPTLPSTRPVTQLQLSTRLTYDGLTNDPQLFPLTERKGPTVGKLSERNIVTALYEELMGQELVAAQFQWELANGQLGKGAGGSLEELERRIARLEIARELDLFPDAKRMAIGKREKRRKEIRIPKLGPTRQCYSLATRVPFVPGAVYDDPSDEETPATTRYVVRQQARTLAKEDPPLDPRRRILIELKQKWDALNPYVPIPADRLEAMLVHFAPQVVQFNLQPTVAWLLRGHVDQQLMSQKQRDHVWKALQAELRRLEKPATKK